jgi:hypothetical protein
MNTALIQNGFLVPPVLRREYIESIRISHSNDSELKAFMYRQVIEEQKAFLRMLNNSDPAPSQEMDDEPHPG